MTHGLGDIWETAVAHYVYLIEGGQYVKIGHSHSPEKRLRSLNIGPVALSIGHVWSFEDRDDAVRLEGRLHKLFAEWRANGEWFLLDKEWPIAIGDATIRYDSVAAGALLDTLRYIGGARAIVAEYEQDEDDEEAEIWRAVIEGYMTRAWSLGLPKTEWDKSIEAWRETMGRC